MPKKKKILINPVSTLGLDDKIHMCYNCLFRHKDTGYCPMFMEYYDYIDNPTEFAKKIIADHNELQGLK